MPQANEELIVFSQNVKNKNQVQALLADDILIQEIGSEQQTDRTDQTEKREVGKNLESSSFKEESDEEHVKINHSE